MHSDTYTVQCTSLFGCFTAGQGNLTLTDLLFFATGVKDVPPMGFPTKPEIHFLHESEENGRPSAYPKANTCSCILQLPVVHGSYQEFVSAISFGIENTHGFGFA